MRISSNLPLVVVSSFERVYRHQDTEFHVLFEGKSQTSKFRTDSWHLTIRRSPEEPAVQYIFQKEGAYWIKTVGINNLPAIIENEIIPWAAAVMARSQPASSPEGWGRD